MRDPGEFASVVVLNTRAEATEIRVQKSSGLVTLQSERWSLLTGADNVSVTIGTRQYPVERRGSQLRLQISFDLDKYYEKVR